MRVSGRRRSLTWCLHRRRCGGRALQDSELRASSTVRVPWPTAFCRPRCRLDERSRLVRSTPTAPWKSARSGSRRRSPSRAEQRSARAASAVISARWLAGPVGAGAVVTSGRRPLRSSRPRAPRTGRRGRVPSYADDTASEAGTAVCPASGRRYVERDGALSPEEAQARPHMTPRCPTKTLRTSSDAAVHPARSSAHRRGVRRGRSRHAHGHDRPGPQVAAFEEEFAWCPAPRPPLSTRGPRPCISGTRRRDWAASSSPPSPSRPPPTRSPSRAEAAHEKRTKTFAVPSFTVEDGPRLKHQI